MAALRRAPGLAARAASIAVRLADVLDATCSPESGARAAAGFLRSYAGSVSAEAEEGDGSPLDMLAARLGLSDAEVTLVLLAGLPEEHEGLAATFRQLHPQQEPHPTLGQAALVLAAASADRSSLRHLAAEGPAFRLGVLRLGGSQPLFERSLHLAPALWDALHGVDGWPADLPRVGVPDPPAGLEAWLALPAVRRARDALVATDDRTVLIDADDDQLTLGRCAALCAAAGRRPIAAVVAPADRAGMAAVVAHAAARHGQPVLLLAPPLAGLGVADLDLGLVPGPVLVGVRPGTVRPVGSRPVLTIPTGPVGADGRRRAWRAALPDLAQAAPDLAARHPLDPAIAAQVGADVASSRRLAGGLDGLTDISTIIRARAGIALPAGTRLVAPRAAWTRLVLGGDGGRQLRDAVARLGCQARVLDDWRFEEQARAERGVRLLFTGPPGTGKTLAAEVVAAAVGTDLLVVDVSQVVSKWVGETEKNLAAVFDAAERTQAVLFFDEADALFAARTEISDAHDRYANLESAYLLQRVDRYEGMAVLATNLAQNVDAAFLRRMHFVVSFGPPDEAERLAIWTLHLPENAPLADDVDLGVLARLYPVPGAWIRNAVVAAAFLAAAEDTSIAQRHLAAGVRREYAKSGRPYPGDPFPAVDRGRRDKEGP